MFIYIIIKIAYTIYEKCHIVQKQTKILQQFAAFSPNMLTIIWYNKIYKIY